MMPNVTTQCANCTGPKADSARHGIGAIALVTGEIGSGKSTALRYVTEKLHPSEYRSLYFIATTGPISELYRQLLHALGAPMACVSKAIMLQRIRNELFELVQGKKLKVVLVIDEASLLRLEVFAELHTLTRFKKDSKPYLTIVLAGQANLVDSLMYRSSMPLASRIVACSRLEGVSRAQMHEYLLHHLAICGAIIVAAKSKSKVVTAEHVRTAATEIF